MAGVVDNAPNFYHIPFLTKYYYVTTEREYNGADEADKRLNRNISKIR